MNMNTDLLDDKLDEMFEETDSEDYNENEIEELQTEVSEDTERSADDGDLKKIHFEVNPGTGILSHKKGSTNERKDVLMSNYSEERPAHKGVQSSYLYEVSY
ncbi:hypothetical protein AVEN_127757-1 [Araneus ventricosus]|uniref:Uncharacterized protein n=1 Tax=Araneus ventricosus TaxID=182803 RepID=A0A4Y2EEU6_ARAVE|nr:hypothetical protein AVEN_127757-1 [Araneus ventricosus]